MGRMEGDRLDNMSIDLHLHSTASDGLLTPAEVVTTAHSLGLKTIALTDHDTISGVEAALNQGQKLGIRVIPGLELNTDDHGDKVHILGYFVDHQCSYLASCLQRLKAERQQRVYSTIERLHHLGVVIDVKQLEDRESEGTLGRSAIARLMIEAGYVKDKKEAYDQFIGEGAPAFVERFKLTPEEAIELIKASGGIPFWAHPGDGDNRAKAKRFMAAGLKGIEAYHHTHTDTTTRYLKGLARDLGLLLSGGSDCHGRQIKGRLRMGSCRVPDTVAQEMDLAYRKKHRIAL